MPFRRHRDLTINSCDFNPNSTGKILGFNFFLFLNLRRAGAMLNKIQHPTIHRAFSAVIPVAAEYYHLYGLKFEPMHYLMAQPSS